MKVCMYGFGQPYTGAKERGELENRVTQLVQEAKDAGNVVLMIDELHTLVREACFCGMWCWCC
jgi:ATP-dependent Clp protease ATP-binding subunit ClpC